MCAALPLSAPPSSCAATPCVCAGGALRPPPCSYTEETEEKKEKEETRTFWLARLCYLCGWEGGRREGKTTRRTQWCRCFLQGMKQQQSSFCQTSQKLCTSFVLKALFSDRCGVTLSRCARGADFLMSQGVGGVLFHQQRIHHQSSCRRRTSITCAKRGRGGRGG